jgi:rod shape-determining protein MreD
MKRFAIYTILILVCFILQGTVFRHLAFAGIVPNLLIVVTAALGLMRGDNTGLIVGFCCGFLVDIFFGDVIGFYALTSMYIGYLNGKLHGVFFPEDMKLPLLLIMVSDLLYGLFAYSMLFMMRSRLNFEFYFANVIFPEMIYTVFAALLLYPLILALHNALARGRQKKVEEDV